jgi:hypothetical protein
MSSWSRPKSTTPAFVPVNKAPLKGITAGYHEGLVPAYQTAALNALGVPLLVRIPIQSREQAEEQLANLAPYSNLSALLLLENTNQQPSWTLDHYKLWGMQFFNETDILGWSPETFSSRTMLYYNAWRGAGFQKPIVSGGIFSVEVNDSGSYHAEKYLTPLLRVAPKDLVIDVHWYGNSDDSWKLKLQNLTKGFRVSCSEYGKPSANPQQDHEQAVYLSSKNRDFYAFGMLFTCVYQANSGPDPLKGEDNFGLWRYDTSIKPGFATLGEVP